VADQSPATAGASDPLKGCTSVEDPNANINIDDEGLDEIKKWESCRLLAYDDKRPDYVLKPGDAVLGTLTIGWGHTGPEVHIGLVWTQQQADDNLRADTDRFQKVLHTLVRVPLTQLEWDALSVFVHNIGPGNFAHSTLLQKLNRGNFEGAAQQFPAWNRSAGQVMAGLIRRRLEEQAMFRQGETPEQLGIDGHPEQADTQINS